jgi:NAD(P)-dependent dehydrogenase (short-subunit alcohol dehydrogenase family)
MRVLITGGSSGIGLATARRLTEAGARVVLLARGEEGLRSAADALPGRAPTIAADVGDAVAMRAAAAEAADLLGGLDAVVADAAAAAYGPFVDMEPDDYLRTIRTALVGVVNTAHASLPHLRDGGGTLVVVGSIAGRVATPWLAPYSAAKHGVRGFARSLETELRALDVPVRVALVAPGPVDTPFWRRARSTDERLPPRVHGAYQPEDVALEVVHALERPRLERTVGGLMKLWAAADAVAPSLVARATASVARLGWRRRGQQPFSPEDALRDPAAKAEVRGGLPSRRSALVAVRDLVGKRR